jgi:hypothetical protein
VVVNSILFQRSQRAGEKMEGVPVDEGQVAEHLAASVRSPSVPFDDAGTPKPEAFGRPHRMLEETYPWVHRTLKKLNVLETGGDGYRVKCEQWDDANNTVALEPGVVVFYQRNTYAISKMRQAGVEVIANVRTERQGYLFAGVP